MKLFSLIVLVVGMTTVYSGDSSIEPLQNTDDQKSILTLGDIDADSMLLVFQHFNRTELQHLRKVNKFFMSCADYKIKQYFKQITVIFQNYGYSEENEDLINIANVSMAIPWLSNFGHYLHKLSIRDINAQNNYKMYKIFEDKCFETLIQLSMSYLSLGFISIISKPFRVVESVTLIGGYKFIDLYSDQLNFNQMFPSLRRLKFINLRAENISKILLNYPYLDQLNIVIDECEEPGTCVNEPAVIDLFRKNPQIQSLDLTNPSENLIKMIAEQVPMLKELKLNEYIDQHNGYEMHFEHVKHFSISAYLSNWPSKITFSIKLEDFESDDQCYHESVTFIERHRHLKRIKIHGAGRIDNIGLMRLAAAELEAINIDLFVDITVDVETIFQFIENSKRLERLKLRLDGDLIVDRNGDDVIIRPRDLQQLLHEKFSSQWNIYRKSDDYKIVAERKST